MTTPTTYTPAELDAAAARIHHVAGCSGKYRRGMLGGAVAVVRCPSCARFAPLDPGIVVGSAQTAVEAIAATVVDARPRYVCPAHLRPVSWRGTGCADCTAEHDERQRDRLAARVARRAAAES